MFVAHIDEVEMASLERAARAVIRGAPLLTGLLCPRLRRGERADHQPRRDGHRRDREGRRGTAEDRRQARPARRWPRSARRLGLPARELAVIGDDLGMDIALGRLGGSRTVLVRSGISGPLDLRRVPARRRPDAVLDGVADLLERL